MRKGASPVITSTLLVLVSVAMAAIFYSWATTSTTVVASAIFADAERVRKEILSDVTILTPPPFKEYGEKQPVIIHNSGSTTLSKVYILYLNVSDSNPKKPEGIKIADNGLTTKINTTSWPVKQLKPGEAIIIWLPPGEYNGYTIIFTSDHYSKSKTIGVP